MGAEDGGGNAAAMRQEGALWVAELAGGWWVAHGATREAALRALKARFEAEMEAAGEPVKVRILAGD